MQSKFLTLLCGVLLASTWWSAGVTAVGTTDVVYTTVEVTNAGTTIEVTTVDTDLTTGSTTTEAISTTQAFSTGATTTASTAEATWSTTASAAATTVETSSAVTPTADESTTVGSTTGAGTNAPTGSTAGVTTVTAAGSTVGTTSAETTKSDASTAADTVSASTGVGASTARVTTAEATVSVSTNAGASTARVTTVEATRTASTDAGESTARVTTVDATTAEATTTKTAAIDSTATTSKGAASTAGPTVVVISTAGTTQAAATSSTRSAASTAVTGLTGATNAGATTAITTGVTTESSAGDTTPAAGDATTAVITERATKAEASSVVAATTATTMAAGVTTAADSTARATTESRTMEVTTAVAGGTTTAAETTEAVDACITGSHDCHEQAACSNSGVGFSCVCNRGYEGNGTYCQDLNECQTGISGCSDICNNTVGSFVCDCPAFFKLDVTDSKTCVAARSCDTSNPCSPSDVSTCAVTDSGYTCGCNSGYKLAEGSETLCVNVDECATGENNCDPTLGMCTDIAGSFNCSCKAGYTGAGTVGMCSDVDECTAGTAVCDTNADCVNTVGAYTCSCQTGYKSIATNGTGFPGECKENRLLPFGQSVGHSELTGSPTSDAASSLINVPDGLPLFGGRLCDTLYVLENGLIVATTLKETQDSVAKTIYRHPTTDAAAFGDPVCAVFAPFWADAVLGGSYPSKVWYHAYQKDSGSDNMFLEKVNEAVRKNGGFNATFFLLVTYETMAMAGETAREDMETNTFQGGIATDGIHTIAVSIYDDGGMNWDPQITDSNLVDGKWPAFVGIIVESANGSLIVVENENSRMKTKQENGVKDCSGTNVYCMDSRAVDGVWIRADDNADNWVNPRKWCADWYNAEPAVSTFASAVPCPLTKAHADLDTRFKAASDVSTGGRACYEQNDGSSFTDGGNSLCCYGESDGAFKLNNKEMSGNVHRYARDSQNYQDYDVKPRQYCCQDTSSSYCSMYFEKRPMMSTEGYEAPQQSAGAGDPHITTLDGFSYSFNGYDEYLMATNTSDAPRVFQMQGRTKLADVEPGKVPLATVFSGLAVKQPTNDVQIYLNGTGTSVDIYVDNTAYTHAGIDDGSNAAFSDGRFQLVKDAGTSAVTGVKAIFTSGISVEVKAGLGMLTYAVSMTPDMKSKLKGLLGNFNGNNADEFAWPNGTAVSFSNASNPSEEELFEWGQSWALRSTGDTSLFSVYPDGTNAATYGNSTFTPLFFNLDSMFPNETDKARAIEVCGGADKKECLFDIALTGNEEVGAAAAAALDAVANSNAALSNTPPVFNVTSEIRATVGQEYGLQLEATDDGAVTISVAQGPGSLNGSNYYTWTPSDTSNYTIQFLATDDVGASTSQTPDITVCACQNGGTCNFDTTLTARSSGFAIATCNCQLGFVGDYCETDYNGCSVTPCYPGVNCTDAVAPLSGGAKEYTCGSCPAGMVGDGESCVDLNECLVASNDSNVHQCKNATCFNEAPGYRCECLSGYSIMADNRTCVDIDECSTGTDNCHVEATCTNTEGSFTCACNTGYSGDGTTCSDIDECQTNNGGCDRICSNSAGSYACSCDVGFRLQNDKHTCEDIDECAGPTNGCQQSCTNTAGGFACTCKEYYALASDGKSCEPAVSCSNDTSCTQLCAVINATEVCDCNAGYNLDSDGITCNDFDECANAANNSCDPTNGQCTNLPGTFNCSCSTGYQIEAGGGTLCDDIDECQTNTGGCAQVCTNQGGSFNCSCNAGYQLNSDGRACDVVNVTTAAPATCASITCLPAGIASCSVVSGQPTCSCSTGYALDVSNRQYCVDIDECSTSCQDNNTICTNSQGSYSCVCKAGYYSMVAQGGNVTCSVGYAVQQSVRSRLPGNNCYWIQKRKRCGGLRHQSSI
ncbi:mucin-like protein [Branchiostoma floridae]|uniref:Mucin-like protein n=1 Tax=Branchiostoma floridae TaxID=7739 RepID=A0A9J7M8F0_BRAFL|nr:mucin-like protein [Branchiostoma floridae]